jgi:hypothetical protein
MYQGYYFSFLGDISRGQSNYNWYVSNLSIRRIKMNTFKTCKFVYETVTIAPKNVIKVRKYVTVEEHLSFHQAKENRKVDKELPIVPE